MSKQQYDKQDCINALQEAYEILEKSPTAVEYQELDISPTYSVFYDIFGSWNKAKEAANIKQYSTGRQYSNKPTMVELSDSEWQELPAYKRHTIKRRVRLYRIKLLSGCNRCGFDKHPSALEFHHTNKNSKEFTISRGYITGSKNWEKTAEEINKCEVLCSNCHRIEESGWPNEV